MPFQPAVSLDDCPAGLSAAGHELSCLQPHVQPEPGLQWPWPPGSWLQTLGSPAEHVWTSSPVDGPAGIDKGKPNNHFGWYICIWSHLSHCKV